MIGLLILGAGGHGKVVADAAYTLSKWDEIAFLDDREDLKEVAGFRVIGKLHDYELLKDKYQYAFVAIGNNKLRLQWLNRLAKVGFIIPTIIHLNSIIGRLCSIGEGTIVMAGSVVNACATIGQGCILNTCCSIDHDCVLDDGVHVSPGAHIGGTVNVGRCTWVCIGASIANNIMIGSNVVVAGGTVVIKNVPDNVIVAGVPAIIKKQLGDDLN